MPNKITSALARLFGAKSTAKPAASCTPCEDGACQVATPAPARKGPIARLLSLIGLVVAVAAIAGCTTKVKDVDTSVLYKAYVNQPNTAEILHMSGPNVCLTITGATNLVLSTPIPVKQIMPRDTTWTEGLFDFLKTATPWLAVWGMSGALGNGAADTTVRGATTVTVPAASTTPATP